MGGIEVCPKPPGQERRSASLAAVAGLEEEKFRKTTSKSSLQLPKRLMDILFPALMEKSAPKRLAAKQRWGHIRTDTRSRPGRPHSRYHSDKGRRSSSMRTALPPGAAARLLLSVEVDEHTGPPA
jgi:hypothetical protein